MSTPGHSEIVKAPCKRVFATNQTDNSAGSDPGASASEPVVSNVNGIIHGGGSMLKIIGFGTDAANEVFSCNIWGWYCSAGSALIWTSQLLCTLSFTLGARTGVAGLDVSDTELFADTVVAGSFVSQFGGDDWIGLSSPADDTQALALVPVIGAYYIEFDVFDSTTASCNILAGVI